MTVGMLLKVAVLAVVPSAVVWGVMPTAARAQDGPPTSASLDRPDLEEDDRGLAPEPSAVAVLLNAGFFRSNGAGLRVGGQDVFLEVSGGYKPVVPRTASGVKFLHSLQLDAELLFDVGHNKKVDYGLGVAYRYNTELGHGGGALGFVEGAFSAHVRWRVMWGLLYFPAADDRLRAKHGYAGFDFPVVIDWGLTGGLLFFL